MLYRRKDSRHRPFVSFWLISTSLYTPMFPSVMCSVLSRIPLAGGYWKSDYLHRCSDFRGNLARIVDALGFNHDQREIFNSILGKEGGYVDHPDDKEAQQCGALLRTLPVLMDTVGYARFNPRTGTDDSWRWLLVGPRFDQVAQFSPDIAAEMCERASTWGRLWRRRCFNVGWMFQPWREVVSRYGCGWANRPATIAALRAYLGNRGKDGERVIWRPWTVRRATVIWTWQRNASKWVVCLWLDERASGGMTGLKPFCHLSAPLYWLHSAHLVLSYEGARKGRRWSWKAAH